MEIPKSKAESENEISATIEEFSSLISYLTQVLEQINSQCPGATIAAVNNLENMLYNLISKQLLKRSSEAMKNLKKLHELSEQVQCDVITVSDLKKEISNFIILLKTIRDELKHEVPAANLQKANNTGDIKI